MTSLIRFLQLFTFCLHFVFKKGFVLHMCHSRVRIPARWWTFPSSETPTWFATWIRPTAAALRCPRVRWSLAVVSSFSLRPSGQSDWSQPWSSWRASQTSSLTPLGRPSQSLSGLSLSWSRSETSSSATVKSSLKGIGYYAHQCTVYHPFGCLMASLKSYLSSLK